jgi:hypothetical protein
MAATPPTIQPPTLRTAFVDASGGLVGTSLQFLQQMWLALKTAFETLAPIDSPTFTGTPAAPTAAIDTNTTQLATTAMVLAQAASATPIIDGVAAVGTSTRFARGDHVHPTDTSRAPTASPTFTGIVTTAGQVAFPASQNPSTDPNTLDDYEEGTWTPTFTFATPGDLSVAYATRTGTYTKVGRQVTITFVMITSAFTHSTASGNAYVTGLAFQVGSAAVGALLFGGITKANYTSFFALPEAGQSRCQISGSGSGQATANIAPADMPTGGTVTLMATTTYIV